MDEGAPLLFLILCVWCSMHSLLRVNGQTVSLQKIQPPGEPVDGDIVALQCNACGLVEGNVIEWVRIAMNTEMIIARNAKPFVTGYSVYWIMSPMLSLYEQFVTGSFNKQYNGVYFCRVKVSVSESSSTLATSPTISVFVPYFPNASYPICFPDGPFTVQEGVTQNMSCTTETAYPPVTIHLLTSYEWQFLPTGDKQQRLLELTVSTADNGTSVECRITSTAFPDMERLCIIGPITVLPSTTPLQTTKILTPSDFATPEPNTMTIKTDKMETISPTPGLPIAIIAGGAGGGACLLLVLILLIFCSYQRGCCKKVPKPVFSDTNQLRSQNTNHPSSHPVDIHFNSNESSNELEQDKYEMNEVTQQPDSPNEGKTSSSRPEVLYALPIKKNSSLICDSGSQAHTPNTVSEHEFIQSQVAPVTTEGRPNQSHTQPVYAQVQKNNESWRENEKQKQMITSADAANSRDADSPDQITHQQYANPVFDSSDAEEKSSQYSNVPKPPLKPTATVKPLGHVSPPVPFGPEENHPPLSNSDTNGTPSAANKQRIKKYAPKSKSISSQDYTPLSQSQDSSSRSLQRPLLAPKPSVLSALIHSPPHQSDSQGLLSLENGQLTIEGREKQKEDGVKMFGYQEPDDSELSTDPPPRQQFFHQQQEDGHQIIYASPDDEDDGEHFEPDDIPGSSAEPPLRSPLPPLQASSDEQQMDIPTDEEGGYNEISGYHDDSPHHDVTYADLDLQRDASVASQESSEEPTLYASIVIH